MRSGHARMGGEGYVVRLWQTIRSMRTLLHQAGWHTMIRDIFAGLESNEQEAAA